MKYLRFAVRFILSLFLFGINFGINIYVCIYLKANLGLLISKDSLVALAAIAIFLYVLFQIVLYAYLMAQCAIRNCKNLGIPYRE